MSGDTMQFWAVAVLIAVIALAIMLYPIVRRKSAAMIVREVYDINVYKDQLGEIDRDLDRGLLDEAQAKAAKVEIKRRMLAAADSIDNSVVKETSDGALSNSGLVATIVLLLPAAAVAMYLNYGRPGQPDQPFVERAGQTRMAGNADQSSLENAATQLAKRLEADPDDLDGWMLLGRSHISLGRFSDAAGAYGRAYELSNQNPDIGANYAESLTLASNSNVTPLAKRIFEQSVTSDPFNAKSRFYLAMHKAQGGDLPGALQGWVDLAALSPPDAPWNEILTQQIIRAGEQTGTDPNTVQPSPDVVVLARQMPARQPQVAPVPRDAGPGPSRDDMKAAAEMSDDDRMAMIRSMVKRLADRLQENPNDKEGWQRLAQVYRVLGETAKADQAADRAAKLP